MAGGRSVKDVGFRLGGHLHRGVLRLSGGRFGARAFGMPVVELHTVGRRSGAPRTTLLTAAWRDGDRVVLVASRGGDSRDPDWYRNLVATPHAELTLEGVRRPIHARTAGAVEREELWPKVVASYRGYATYQRRTSRVIPLVVCEPR